MDDLKIDEPDFKVPHSLMEERDFVMKPLKEILSRMRNKKHSIVLASDGIFLFFSV